MAEVIPAVAEDIRAEVNREGRGAVKKKKDLPADDIGFLNLMLDQMATKFSVDTARIYVTGLSWGGFMAMRVVYSSSRWVTLFIPFVGMRFGGGTGEGLSSREPGEGGRCCRFFPNGGVRG